MLFEINGDTDEKMSFKIKEDIDENNITWLKISGIEPKKSLNTEELELVKQYERIYLYCFNSPIDNLPDNVKYIKNRWRFNKPINNLPQNLIYLSLHIHFNQSLDFLPLNLETLEIYTNEFNKPLNNLPNSLKVLILNGYTYCHPLDNLPNNLETLQLRLDYYEYELNNLPKSLKTLELCSTSCHYYLYKNQFNILYLNSLYPNLNIIYFARPV